jgi:hypothetical protein
MNDQKLPLAERRVSWYEPDTMDASPGRRLRVFAALVAAHGTEHGVTLKGVGKPFFSPSRPMRYGELMQAIERSPRFADVRQTLSDLSLRVNHNTVIRSVDEYKGTVDGLDPNLHPALQDLAYEINEDIVEACQAFDNPDHYYPGIDDGIEPVGDEHVSFVIWGLQRELNRETRSPAGRPWAGEKLPPAPLAQLPWRIQRALVERRRWRYLQWGIGREQWLAGRWSLWEVMEDPGYVPRRVQRLLAAS